MPPEPEGVCQEPSPRKYVEEDAEPVADIFETGTPPDGSWPAEIFPVKSDIA